MREIVAMLGWLTPLYLVCVLVSLPNEIKLLLLIYSFLAVSWFENLKKKISFHHTKEESIKEQQFDLIRQTDIKHKPNIEVRASLS